MKSKRKLRTSLFQFDESPYWFHKAKKTSVALRSEGGMANGLRSKVQIIRAAVGNVFINIPVVDIAARTMTEGFFVQCC